MNFQLSQQHPHNTARSPSQTLSFLSTTPRARFQLISPTFSPTKKHRRGSCAQYPSLSPKALNSEPSQLDNLNNPAQKFSIFSSNSSQQVSSHRGFASGIQSIIKFSPRKTIMSNASKGLSSVRKDMHSILKDPIIGIAERFSKGMFAGTPSALDESFNSLSSDRSKPQRKESCHFLRNWVQRNRQKITNIQTSSQKTTLLQLIRRKSCYCSDCGGLSKKEKTNMNVVAPSNREALRESKINLRFSVNEGGSGLPTALSHATSNKSFAFRSTPKSMNSLSSKHRPQKLKSLASFEGFEEKKQPYSLSRFARSNKKCSTVNILNDEDENVSNRSKNAYRPEIAQFSIEDEDLEGKGESSLGTSLEDIGQKQPEIKRRTARNTPSLDLDVHSISHENKRNLEEEDNKKDSISQNNNKAFEDKGIKIKKGRNLIKEKPVSGKIQPEQLRKTVPNLKVHDNKVRDHKEKKEFTGVELALRKKIKQIAILGIYSPRSNPASFRDTKSLKTVQNQYSARTEEIKAIECNNESLKVGSRMMDNFMNTTSAKGFNLDNQRKSQPVVVHKAVHALPLISTINKDVFSVNKESGRTQSLSSFRKVTESQEDISKSRFLTNNEFSKQKKEAQERVLVSSSNGKRKKVKTLLVGDLKKAYKTITINKS